MQSMVTAMNEFIQHRASKILSAVLFCAGVSFFLLLVPRHDLPMRQLSPQTTINISKPTSLTADQIRDFFDISKLPETPTRAPVAEIIDPAADLLANQLIGITIGEGGAIALIKNGSEIIQLRIGDKFLGFDVLQILPRQVVFKKENLEARLDLPRATEVPKQ